MPRKKREALRPIGADPQRYVSLKGCKFLRTGPYTIKVWREGACACGNLIATGVVTISCTHDKGPILGGLELAPGPMPAEGYMLYSGGPIQCGPCRQRWLSPATRSHPRAILNDQT